jgi:hypothetical protein
VIGRTVVALRPSMRGSPLRMRWRTMLLSSLNSELSTSSAVYFGASPPERARMAAALISPTLA